MYFILPDMVHKELIKMAILFSISFALKFHNNIYFVKMNDPE